MGVLNKSECSVIYKMINVLYHLAGTNQIEMDSGLNKVPNQDMVSIVGFIGWGLTLTIIRVLYHISRGKYSCVECNTLDPGRIRI